MLLPREPFPSSHGSLTTTPESLVPVPQCLGKGELTFVLASNTSSQGQAEPSLRAPGSLQVAQKERWLECPSGTSSLVPALSFG